MPRNGFDVLKTKEAILKIEKEMAEPDFWNHRESAEKKSQELSQLKKRIAEYEQYAGEVGSLIEMLQIADEGMANEIAERARKLKKNFDKFMLLKRFTNPYDKGNAVLSIFAGAGGKDSEDWVAMLRRMYERWAEIGGYGTAAVHEHWGEQNGPSGWGLKNVSILVKGAYAYGYLKRESGVHRLVRISPFSSQSLRHTPLALFQVVRPRRPKREQARNSSSHHACSDRSQRIRAGRANTGGKSGDSDGNAPGKIVPKETKGAEKR